MHEAGERRASAGPTNAGYPFQNILRLYRVVEACFLLLYCCASGGIWRVEYRTMLGQPWDFRLSPGATLKNANRLPTLAMPKSPSLTTLERVRKMFCVLRSRWRILRSWMCFRASVVCTNLSSRARTQEVQAQVEKSKLQTWRGGGGQTRATKTG